MPELRVPQIVDNAFRDHYRELILASIERSAGAQLARRRVTWRDAPAREAAAASETAERWFGTGLRSAARVVWLATLALLACDVAAFGLHSWTTSVADIALIVLTFVWFGVCIDDLLPVREEPPEQLGLFDPEPPSLMS